MRPIDGLKALNGGGSGGSPWRLFPLGLVAALALVVAVNGALIAAALRTFPGKTEGQGFDLNNRYNAVLERVEAQAALGWRLEAMADGEKRPVLWLRDRGGRPVERLSITAMAQRPVGDLMETPLRFVESEPGRYRADSGLSVPGQWDLLISIDAQDQQMAATRRIVLR